MTDAGLDRAIPRADRTCKLYRHFNADGELLYVGISLNAVARLARHRDKPWIDQIVRIEVQSYPSREEAMEAERAAIQRERPRFNIVHAHFPHLARSARVVPESAPEQEPKLTDEVAALRFRVAVLEKILDVTREGAEHWRLHSQWEANLGEMRERRADALFETVLEWRRHCDAFVFWSRLRFGVLGLMALWLIG